MCFFPPFFPIFLKLTFWADWLKIVKNVSTWQILFIDSIDLKMQPASDAWHLTNSSIPTGCLLSKQS